MAENIDSGTQARNLDTLEQQIQAVRFMLEHGKKAEEIKLLNELQGDYREKFTREQIQAIENEIATCKDSLNETMDKLQREYGVIDLAQLGAELGKSGIKFIESKYDYLINPSEQSAQQAAQQAGQNEVRPQSPEKGIAELEALEISMQHFKNAMNLAEDMKRNYEAMKEEFRMAVEYVQRASYELYQSFQRLMEVREWNLPERQHDNVLSSKIRESFGLDEKQEPHKNDRQHLEKEKRDYEQKFEEQLNRHYQKSEQTTPEHSHFQKSHQEPEQSQRSVTEQRKAKAKEQGNFQQSYHNAERGRASTHAHEFGKKTGWEKSR